MDEKCRCRVDETGGRCPGLCTKIAADYPGCGGGGTIKGAEIASIATANTESASWAPIVPLPPHASVDAAKGKSHWLPSWVEIDISPAGGDPPITLRRELSWKGTKTPQEKGNRVRTARRRSN